MNLRAALSDLLRRFEEREIPAAVIGALGLHGYGLSRATYDVDLIVPGDRQQEVVDLMAAQGYETLYVSTGYSNHVHDDPRLGRVDFVYVSGETRDTIFDHVGEREIFPGFRAPVPRAEHLAAMKIHAMKNDPDRVLQDMTDLRFMLRLPGLDRDEVRQAFEKRGMSSRYDELVWSLENDR